MVRCAWPCGFSPRGVAATSHPSARCASVSKVSSAFPASRLSLRKPRSMRVRLQAFCPRPVRPRIVPEFSGGRPTNPRSSPRPQPSLFKKSQSRPRCQYGTVDGGSVLPTGSALLHRCPYGSAWGKRPWEVAATPRGLSWAHGGRAVTPGCALFFPAYVLVATIRHPS